MIKKLILAFKTHFDIGFTDLSRNVIAQYAGEMLHDVAETCGATADMGPLRYVWTMPAWPLTVMGERSADGGKALDALVENGQIAWHALPYTSHFDVCGVEEAVRSLHVARDLSAKYGRPLVQSAKMTDVPGHGQLLPTILAGAGVKFLHLGCNEFATPPDVPELFFWEGPDGSRVLTCYEKNGYGSTLEPPEGWPFPVWLALLHTHDNCGPQSAELIRELAGQARRLFPEAEIVCGTMDDFWNELSRCDLSQVPVVRRDLADSWIHGAMTYPREISLLRQVRRDLVRGETLSALTGGGQDPAQEIARAYDALSLFDEHTWGLDVKTWMDAQRVYEKEAFLAALGSDEYRHMEESWREQTDRADEAARLAALALEKAQAGEEVCLLNPNGSAFTGWADVTGADVPGVEEIGGRKYVYVERLPPLSAGKPSPVAPVAADWGDGLLENHRYAVRYDAAAGRIESVYDKKLGRMLLESRGGEGVFSYRYDRYGMSDLTEFLRSYGYRFTDWGVHDYGRDNYPECAHKTFRPAPAGCERRGNTLLLRYRTGTSADRYGDARGITLEVTLPGRGDELFVTLHMEDKQRTPYLESGSLTLPLAFADPAYGVNKNGTLLDPARDIMDGANHAFYTLEAFADAREGGAGLCAVTHDAPLLSIGETGAFMFRHRYEPHEPSFVFNLFNNMWGTNFPQWTGGSFTYRFTLFGHSAWENPMQRALSLSQGAAAVRCAPFCSPVGLPEGVQVCAFYRFGGGRVLRLRDVSGVLRQASLRANALAITPFDLQNRPAGERVHGALSFEMRPYGLMSFYLEEEDA